MKYQFIPCMIIFFHQNEFLIHAQELEIENSKLREKLAERDEQLESMTLEHEKTVKEKDEKIDSLQVTGLAAPA